MCDGYFCLNLKYRYLIYVCRGPEVGCRALALKDPCESALKKKKKETKVQHERQQ